MSEVIDPAKLSLLTAPELQRLVGGEGAGSGADSEWEYGKIMASVVCRHGYSTESAQVRFLLFFFSLLFVSFEGGKGLATFVFSSCFVLFRRLDEK